MSSALAPKDDRVRFPGVRAPKPLLSPKAERELSDRQLDLLDALEAQLTAGGVADLTMAQIAARVNCSLRTLYAIAPRKDELILVVVDRRLRRIGRAAVETFDASMLPLDALRAYLQAANEAVQPEAVALSADFAKVTGAEQLLSAHEDYLIAVTQNLLDRAVSERQIPQVDTAAVAHVLGGLGREFARPELAETMRTSPKATADAITDLLLAGLRAGSRPDEVC
ncbi:MAG: TetR/AcrR family transcriptional regulator [Candidatus Binatia bacterium]|nr:TetR/AcrR family transcriptional regulator [Candidatus Binatia bacterium]